MSKLLQIIFGICTALVFIGAVQIISPKKTMKKSINYILGIVFVLTLMVPAMTLKDMDFSFEVPTSSQAYTSSQLNEYTVNYLAEALLKNAQINYKSIKITTDILEDNRISITKVIIVSNEPKEKIVDALAELVPNTAVEVINE